MKVGDYHKETNTLFIREVTWPEVEKKLRASGRYDHMEFIISEERARFHNNLGSYKQLWEVLRNGDIEFLWVKK